MFEIVYCAFFFQWGYPAGPELTNGDWLSFLGGYLEFSGALVMAWLVYRQSETINKLAMQEYRIGVKAIPDKIELKEYLEEDQSHVFCTYMDKGVPKLYIKHDCVLDTKATKTQLLHKNIPFFYFHIINKGKTKIERLKFNAVSIISPETKQAGRYLFKKNNGGNILNGTYTVAPECCLYICFAFQGFPDSLPLNTVNVEFQYNIGDFEEKQFFTFLIQRESNKIIITDGEIEVHQER